MKGNFWFYERGAGDPDPRPMTVRTLMTPHPITLTPEMPTEEAYKLIRKHDIRHIPIVRRDTGELVGLVTETDLLRRILHGHALTEEERYHEALDHMLPLGEIMVRDVITLPPEAKVAEAVSIFLQHKIRCVPVVSAERRLLGIVTESDLMKLLEHMVAH